MSTDRDEQEARYGAVKAAEAARRRAPGERRNGPPLAKETSGSHSGDTGPAGPGQQTQS